MPVKQFGVVGVFGIGQGFEEVLEGGRRSSLRDHPWREFIDPVDLMLDDAVEEIRQPGLRVGAVELGGLDQGAGHV